VWVFNTNRHGWLAGILDLDVSAETASGRHVRRFGWLVGWVYVYMYVGRGGAWFRFGFTNVRQGQGQGQGHRSWGILFTVL